MSGEGGTAESVAGLIHVDLLLVLWSDDGTNWFAVSDFNEERGTHLPAVYLDRAAAEQRRHAMENRFSEDGTSYRVLAFEPARMRRSDG